MTEQPSTAESPISPMGCRRPRFNAKQRGTGALLGGGYGGVPFAERGQHFDRQPLQPAVTLGALATALCLHL
jgi:hypothetical protein